MKKITAFLAAFLLASTAMAQRQQTLFPPGTALYPGLVVNSDRKSGLFQKDASTLAFSVNGVESFSFTKSGIIGSGIPGFVTPPAGNSYMVHLDPDQVPESAGSVWGLSNGLKFEGTTADDFEITIGVVGSPTSDTIYVMQDSANAEEYFLSSKTATDAPLVDDGSEVLISSPLRYAVQEVVVADTGDANPAVGTITPSSSFVALTCSDDGQQPGCEMHLSETGAVDGQRLTVALVATSFSVEWEDDAGVMVGTNPSMNAVGDTVEFVYSSTASLWIMTGNSMNGRGNFRATLADNRPNKVNAVWSELNAIKFEGSTEDGWELALLGGDPAADANLSLYQEGASGIGLQFVTGTQFANLPSAADGVILYCVDCNTGASPCTGSSTGSFAFREQAAWNCK